jgi:membrane protein implicated in regulation of membrane protease activity
MAMIPVDEGQARQSLAFFPERGDDKEETIMTRAITLKGVVSVLAGVVTCVLVGSLAGRIAWYFDAPMEIRLLTFAIVTGLSLLVWYYVRTSEGK